ncbi:hypothetical protein JNB85_07690 [Rhizobium mesosinicum]|uniref:Uncharacterized protein n=2 Tax=Rhizobium mesosinicum TaxID=335017 RepID=A0ABS7GQR8_9HYPH|nr:hypothetical protein [Rhizobium mesosinicum]
MRVGASIKMTYEPKYKWRETWPGEGRQDFTGYDGDDIVGRIRLDTTTSDKIGLWRWNGGFASWIRERIMPQQGWEENPREASRRAEEHHDRLKALHGR